MFQFDLSTWVQNNFWRIFSFSAFLCFLLMCLVIKKEKKRIYYSLAREKVKIFWQAAYLLFFLAIIHLSMTRSIYQKEEPPVMISLPDEGSSLPASILIWVWDSVTALALFSIMR